MKRLGLVGLFALTFVAAANGDQMRAGELYQLCTAKNKQADLACSMWVVGFLSGITAVRQVPKTITPVCPPKEATPGQARLVIEHFLREDRGSHGLPAALAAYGALGLAYPCP
jgi:hypothetical protein